MNRSWRAALLVALAAFTATHTASAGEDGGSESGVSDGGATSDSRDAGTLDRDGDPGDRGDRGDRGDGGTDAGAPKPGGKDAPNLAPGARPDLEGAPPVQRDEDGRRIAPDYDGRARAHKTAGQVALWVPRILLYPLYLISEYVLRKPLGALTKTAEQDQWAKAVQDFLTFDSDHKVGITPSAFIDFGLRPSVGLYFFWDDFIKKGNDLRAYGATWGPPWLAASLADRISLGRTDSFLTFRGSFTRRRDWVYYGVGPRTLEADRSRYSSDVLEAGMFVDYKVAPSTFFSFGGGSEVRFLRSAFPSLRRRSRAARGGGARSLRQTRGLRHRLHRGVPAASDDLRQPEKMA